MNEDDDVQSSPSRTRNPSPPLHLREKLESLEGDRIGNTTFSKHWLFTTLMKLIEEVEKEQSETSEFGVDVDEELQNELCKLWDMSMNADVASFLEQFQAIDILTEVTQRSKAPRVTEICVGILGNMACDGKICEKLSEKNKLIEMVLDLLKKRDPPTLVETTRLIFTCLSCKAATPSWLNIINSSESLHENLIFILKSSTNVDLLKNTGELVDILLDLQEDICNTWATPEFIQAILEAIKQLGVSHSQPLEIYFHVLQLLTTTDSGAEALVSCADSIETPLMKYLNQVCDDEIVGIEDREACIASALSVLNILFSANEDTSKRLTKDEKLIRILVKILEPLYPWLQDMKKTMENNSDQNQPTDYKHSPEEKNDCTDSSADEKTDCNKTKESDSNKLCSNSKKEHKHDSVEDTCEENSTMMRARDSKEYQHMEILYHIIQGFLYDYMFTLQMVFDSEAEEEDSTKLEMVKFLSYLNDLCSRVRINHLVLTMKDSINEAFDPVELLTELASKNDQERLVRIIGDALAGKNFDRSDSNTDEKNNT